MMPSIGFSQSGSVARQWNEVLLEGIRNDFARPTVHARNLFHISAAMYDAWAVYETDLPTYFLGKEIHGYPIAFEGFSFDPSQKEDLRKETISYAAYTLMAHRFAESPGQEETQLLMDSLMRSLGYDPDFKSTDYSGGSAAALGNHIASQIRLYGFQDGANERGNYENLYYHPLNGPLDLEDTIGTNYLSDPNRWQPLQFESFTDQSGNVIGGGVVDFLSPEWGNVNPFSLTEDKRTRFIRDGKDYNVYYDPGAPPYIDSISHRSIDDPYKWNFALVSVWSGHLDPRDGVMWDISPAGIGNIPIGDIPDSFEDFSEFYNFSEGGDISKGYELNPVTNQPYPSQMVPRGDYTRVLAEFWADGPDSETPPGHWFVILNYVMDQPEFRAQWEGKEELDPLEFEIKAYFTLGGAMHDVAIASWGVKGYYDYIRPISAIRFMASRGQSSDRGLPNYDSLGLPLIEGSIELISENDPLAGKAGEYLGDLKVMAWRGHRYIDNTETDQAGVGWIRAKQWWPYQRPSFVTPPFAGYVSGHSTYSRAAAEILTRITGSEYFPGGVGEFVAKKNEFLVFEEGPSMDVTLQWAKYSDASDQCSLSRIWGGIHPPADDLPGRKMGAAIGKGAFDFANSLFGNRILSLPSQMPDKLKVFPNPTTGFLKIKGADAINAPELRLINMNGRVNIPRYMEKKQDIWFADISNISAGLYIITINGNHSGRLLIR